MAAGDSQYQKVPYNEVLHHQNPSKYAAWRKDAKTKYTNFYTISGVMTD